MAENSLKALQKELAIVESRLAAINNERDEILQKISRLKFQIGDIHPPANTRLPHQSASTPTASADKVKLFMALFRGRTDVFPKRWENKKSGRKGYSPACSNEWVRGLCRKPKVKCGECKAQAFISVTEKTTDGEDLDAFFHGELTATQQRVVEAMVAHDIGIFVAPPGSGKGS